MEMKKSNHKKSWLVHFLQIRVFMWKHTLLSYSLFNAHDWMSMKKPFLRFLNCCQELEGNKVPAQVAANKIAKPVKWPECVKIRVWKNFITSWGSSVAPNKNKRVVVWNPWVLTFHSHKSLKRDNPWRFLLMLNLNYLFHFFVAFL